MKRVHLQWESWLYGLFSGIISGVSTTILSVIGVTAVDQIGLSIKQFDLRQLGMLATVSGIIGAAMYLKQSPLPKEEIIEETTTTLTSTTTTATATPSKP